ncbi:MAG: nif-specific transcriptional activator NifA [Deltaproteobacteria bacterium]|nr:nif-specific transcriptional activator NifA [Deltaproteobacteria bacterium]
MKAIVNTLELKVLFDISRIIGQALDLDNALHTVLGILSDSLEMKRATVTLKEEESGNLVIRASYGLSEAEEKRGVYRQDEGVTGLIFRTAEPFIVPDISREPLFLNKTRAREIEKGRIAFLGVPILLHGSSIGVLSVDRLFSNEISFEEDIRFLSIVATLIAQFVSLNQEVRAREEKLRRENLTLRARLSERYNHFFALGKSPSMADVHRLIRRVAPSKALVLLLGESGTGKTLIARIIHELSNRTKFPFVKINCASLPENLLESELFGHEKGAFTGAAKAKPGRFEEADGGTIFLDEIGELPYSLQAKLLRFLQEREFERLGSSRTRKVDVRIIAATNRDLSEAVREGVFREDLYYRLNVFPIHVPPLRERREDIPSLVHHFLDKTSKEYGRTLRITPHALQILVNYEWPGNVRELENLMERLAIMVDGNEIDLEHYPQYLQETAETLTVTERRVSESLSRLEEMEKKEVVAALERNRWIQSQAAKELGLTLRQVGYRIKKFGLEKLVNKRRAGKRSMRRGT